MRDQCQPPYHWTISRQNFWAAAAVAQTQGPSEHLASHSLYRLDLHWISSSLLWDLFIASTERSREMHLSSFPVVPVVLGMATAVGSLQSIFPGILLI